MAKTRHIEKRMSQRGIQQEMLNIVKQFGVDEGDKVTLNRKGLDCALLELKQLSIVMERMQKRGGIVLVASNDSEITTYDLDSYSRNRKRQMERNK
ncbi:hypothetical protein [Leucothrix arctica]|uniref:DUF4258 domain-containing protein n=1 Tax=Leucothrix arctica TaxID=1481894 RepID=A0A317C496_9GAMM|nr:hypothetical protein [Leucothrix arctica]PWQ93099.1 hypothetical protein DKT75_20635 [Leucothrix arctica]